MSIHHLTGLYMGAYANLPVFLAVMFGLFAVLAYAFACVKQRRLLAAWRDVRDAVAPATLYRTLTVRFDIKIFWFQLLFVTPAVAFVGSLYSAERLAKLLIAAHGAPAISLGGHPIAATLFQVFASQILGTFGAFLFHYAGHKTPLFWSLHKVHHSAEALSPFTAARGHPIDTLLGGSISFVWRTLVVGVALYVTGGAFTPIALTILGLLGMATLIQDALNHSHVPLSYGWFNRLWVGPLFHHVHHSADLKHRDKNFGGGVPVWDWLFGTMYLPDPDEALRLGLNDAEIGEANPHNTVRGYMIEPMAEFARELLRLVRGLGTHTTFPPTTIAAADAGAGREGGVCPP